MNSTRTGPDAADQSQVAREDVHAVQRDTAPAEPPKRLSKWKTPLVAGGVASSVALVASLGHDGLGDTDPYRHLVYAHLLWKSGLGLRGHPFLPFTLLGNSSADLWYGFHLFCIPFSMFGMLWGARAAAMAVAGLSAGISAWLYQRLGQRHALLFALAPLAISGSFLYRDHVARPAHLTIPLVEISLMAGVGALGPAWAAGAAFAYGLLHVTSPLAVVFSLIGAVSLRVVEKKWRLRPVLWAIAGLGLALVIRPDRASFVGVAWLTAKNALASGGVRPLFQAAQELAPLPLESFAKLCLIPCFLIIGLGAAGRNRHASEPAVRIAALFATGATALMCLRSARFEDYFLPLACLAMAAYAPSRVPSGLTPKLVLGALSTTAAVMVSFGVRRAWRLGDAYIAKPSSYAKLASALHARVPKGSVIVSEDLIMTSVLWAFAPDYRYIGAYDPSTLYTYSPPLFWRWANMVRYGRDCVTDLCSPGPADPQATANVIHAFGSEYFVSFYPRKGFTVLSMMHAHPERFELLDTEPAPVGRLSLWKVIPAQGDAPWSRADEPVTWMP